MTQNATNLPRAQQGHPVRIGVFDDCPFRRVAIREALHETRRYHVPICSPLCTVRLAGNQGLDGMLVAVAQKGKAHATSARGACTCERSRGLRIGYQIHSFLGPETAVPEIPDFAAAFQLPEQPTDFVAHLDRIFGAGPPVANLDRCDIPSGQRPLSKRECAVFDLLGTGKEVKEVAAHLGLSPKTIYKFAERIRRKRGYATLHDLLFATARSPRNGYGM